MTRRIALAALISAQAAALLVAGSLTFYYSHSLMLWLIQMVGKERALGVGGVIQQGDGSTLIISPFQICWALPFWGLSAVQISSAFTLLNLGYRDFRAGRSTFKFKPEGRGKL